MTIVHPSKLSSKHSQRVSNALQSQLQYKLNQIKGEPRLHTREHVMTSQYFVFRVFSKKKRTVKISNERRSILIKLTMTSQCHITVRSKLGCQRVKHMSCIYIKKTSIHFRETACGEQKAYIITHIIKTNIHIRCNHRAVS